MTGVRGSFFLTPAIEEATSAYLKSCREVVTASDPTMAEEAYPQLVQAMVNMALQQVMFWSSQRRGEAEDPDMLPSQALIGAFAGIGISLAMLRYDPEEVLFQALPAMMRAWTEACTMIEASDAPTVN